jgi:hypothetical protein
VTLSHRVGVQDGKGVLGTRPQSSPGIFQCRRARLPTLTLLAEGMLEARRAGEEDEAARLRAVARRFRAAGIDLAQPYRRSDVDAPTGTSRIVQSAANLVDWLRGRGLLSGGHHETRWQIRSHASRNRNFAVAREDGSGYFVKQLRVHGDESLRMMEREAAVYEILADPDGPLRDLSPAFYGFDRDAQALIFALLPNAERQPSALTAAFATAAGRTLGLLHRRPSANLAGTSRAERFDRCPPGNSLGWNRMSSRRAISSTLSTPNAISSHSWGACISTLQFLSG